MNKETVLDILQCMEDHYEYDCIIYLGIYTADGHFVESKRSSDPSVIYNYVDESISISEVLTLTIK